MADDDEREERERRRLEDVSRKILNKQASLSGSDDSVIVHVPRPKLQGIVDDALDNQSAKFGRRSSSIEPVNEVVDDSGGPVRNNWTRSQEIPYMDDDDDEGVTPSSPLRASDSNLARPPKFVRKNSRPLTTLEPPPDYEDAIHDPVPDTNLDNDNEVQAAMKLSSVGFQTEVLEREGTLMNMEELNPDHDVPSAATYKRGKKKKKKSKDVEETDVGDKVFSKPRKRSKKKKSEETTENTEIFLMSYKEDKDAVPERSLPPLDHARSRHWDKAITTVQGGARFLPPPKIIRNEDEQRTETRDDVETAEPAIDKKDECFLLRLRHRLTSKKVIIASIIAAVLLGVIIFLAVFPPSFVYLEYHLMALKYNKITGSVDRSETFYGGCYLLGPSTGFVNFTATVHTISLTKGVFTADRLPITITYHLQYFLKGAELGELHRDYGLDYNSVISSVVDSEIKNLAVPYKVDEFRLNRAYLEKYFHEKLKIRLGGNCCSSCCPFDCTNNTVCASCVFPPGCSKGYHVRVPYFNLAAVDIPEVITERYLYRTLLQVQAEAEYFKQEHAVEVKSTLRQTSDISNQASEVEQAGYAESAKINVISQANREGNITEAYVTALGDMYSTLGIASEEHKLSVFMIRALEDQAVKGNLYRGYNYNMSTLWTSPHGSN